MYYVLIKELSKVTSVEIKPFWRCWSTAQHPRTANLALCTIVDQLMLSTSSLKVFFACCYIVKKISSSMQNRKHDFCNSKRENLKPVFHQRNYTPVHWNFNNHYPQELAVNVCFFFMSPEDEKTCHRAEMATLTEVDSTGEVFLQAIGNKQGWYLTARTLIKPLSTIISNNYKLIH